MSLSIQELVSDGTLSTVVLGVEYLQRNDIYMRIAGVETPQSGAPSGYTWSFVDNNTIKILPVVPAGVTVVIYRRTDLDAMYNIFSQNAQFDESTIDENNQQLLFIAQEYFEQAVTAKGIESIEYVSEDAINVYYRFVLADGTYTNSFAIPKSAGSADGASAKEALRRTYADAGLTVKGYTADGATLTSVSDVVIHNASGKGYSWDGVYPVDGYIVVPGTDPALNPNFTDRSPVLLRGQLAAIDSAKFIGGAYYQDIKTYTGDATVIDCIGRSATYRPGFGRFYLDALDTTTLDDGGCVLVDALGRRWKRDLTGTDEVLVEWYGECIQNLDISLFASSAIDFALKNAIPYVTLPCTKMGETAFLWENNITKDLGVAGTFDLTIRGHGVGHSVTRIRHTNTALGYGLTLQRTTTGTANIFSVAALKNVWITGNTSSKGFIRFADMFGVRVEKVFGTGYGLSTTTDKGSLVTLANLKYWTEGAVLIDVHSRDNFALIKFERNSATGGTASFFGLVMKRCWHRFNSVGGGAIFIKGYTAENNVVVYGSMIEIGGWFESGTDNALILTGDYGSIVASTVNAMPDGFGGNLNGEAVRICKQTGMSSIDITLNNLGQGIPFSLDGFATGATVYSFSSLGLQETPSAINKDGYPIPRLRMRGGSLIWVANPTTDKRLVIANLPIYSSLHVKFAVIGSNKIISNEYLVTTFGRNEVADVKLLAGGTIDSHFFARTLSGLAAKTVSTAGGALFEILMNATTAAGTDYKMKMEVTIL